MKIQQFVFNILTYVMTQFSVMSPTGGTFQEEDMTILNVSLGGVASHIKGLWF